MRTQAQSRQAQHDRHRRRRHLRRRARLRDDRRAPGVLHERHARRCRRWPTTAARTRTRAAATRPTSCATSPRPARTPARRRYHIPIDDAMKLVVDDCEGAIRRTSCPALPPSTKPTIEPIFGRPQAARAPCGAGSGARTRCGLGSGRRAPRRRLGAPALAADPAAGSAASRRRLPGQPAGTRGRGHGTGPRLRAKGNGHRSAHRGVVRSWCLDRRCSRRRRRSRIRRRAIDDRPGTAADVQGNDVAVDEQLGAQVPLDATFRTRTASRSRSATARGRPADNPDVQLLRLPDAVQPAAQRALGGRCRSSAEQGSTASQLLRVGAQFRIVTIDLEPNEPLDKLAKMNANATSQRLPGVRSASRRAPAGRSSRGEARRWRGDSPRRRRGRVQVHVHHRSARNGRIRPR